MPSQTQESNVISARVLWDRMVDKAITKYEYSGNYAQFVSTMQCLGFEREQVEELVMEDFE